MSRYTRVELEAYLDEALHPSEMAAVEAALREDSRLVDLLAEINRTRDAGLHSLGEIWRRHRVSCPSRQQLGSFLLGAQSAELETYIQFHLDTIGCRFCRANLEDLRRQQAESSDVAVSRRKKYFDSSAGYLGGNE